MSTGSSYTAEFWDGVSTAVDLVRGGASIDMVASLLPHDAAFDDPQAYQDRLAEIRKSMNLGFGDADEEVSL
ncbi:MAG: hypothetical protein ABFE01_07420 [Phycisphaerales bacterium]